MWLGLCIAVTLSWVVLALFWHRFWQIDQRLPLTAPQLTNPPSVTAIVPARNEAETIEQCLKSLQSQNYTGEFKIIVVNDNSTDDTGVLIRAMAGESETITAIDAAELPGGWAGKMWALDNGVKLARQSNTPTYFWFTDADISHGPGVLSVLVHHASSNRLAIVSQMVKLRARTFWEKLLVPAFIFYFALLYPFRAVNDPASRIAGAAGGSVLVRADALADIGGIEAIRDAVIDDCTLGRMVKASGRKIYLGFGERSCSLRGYDQLADFWQMVRRSAYTQLKFSPLLLGVALFGIVFSHTMPLVQLCIPALAVMAFIYWPVVRFYGLSPFWALTLPVAGTLFGLMTVSSALAHWRGADNKWRGRQI